MCHVSDSEHNSKDLARKVIFTRIAFSYRNVLERRSFYLL